MERSNVLIKRAGLDDIDKIMPLIKRFYDESVKEYGLPYNPKSVEASTKLFVAQHLCLYAETLQGEVIGVIAGMVIPFPLDHEFIMFQEFVWYVKQEYGSLMIGMLMFNDIEDYCKNCGIKVIVMGSLGNRNPSKMGKFLTRRGYKLLETHYMREV